MNSVVVTWYYMRFHCTKRFIPQHVYGCKRKLRKHDLSSEETPERLPNYIPGTKNYIKKMKFSIKDFFSKYDQICSFLRIWSHLLEKSLMENFTFCAGKSC